MNPAGEKSFPIIYGETTGYKMYDSSAEGDAPEAGAPEVEIEITPEMVEAGCEALSSLNDDFECREDGVKRIFLAMLHCPQDKKRVAEATPKLSTETQRY